MVKQQSLKLSSLLFVNIFITSFSFAGVENTHHDIAHVTGNQDKSICAFCHIPHSARSDRGLFSMEGKSGDKLGRIGAFCYACHDGTVTPNALVVAPDGTLGLEALTMSHGYNNSALKSVSGGLEGNDNIQRSGLLTADKLTGEIPGQIECTTCHDVHNNTYPPFLRAPIESLCIKCHSGSNFTGKGRWTTVEDEGSQNCAHSIGMPVAATPFDHSRNLPVEQKFHQPDPIYDVVLFTSEEISDPNKHWETGGHLVGVKKAVSCITCHSAHMPNKDLLVGSSGTNGDKKLCGGCHGDGNNFANPGVTDGYHPVFEESEPPYLHYFTDSNTSIDFELQTVELFVTIPSRYPIDSNGQITCLTCHVMHNGGEAEKCLVKGLSSRPGGVICNECHGTGSYTRDANWHHPVGPENYNALSGFEKLTAWAWGPGLPGDLTDGLQCVDCHIDWAISAHNW